jgi:hypothetical protein
MPTARPTTRVRRDVPRDAEEEGQLLADGEVVDLAPRDREHVGHEVLRRGGVAVAVAAAEVARQLVAVGDDQRVEAIHPGLAQRRRLQ